MPELKTLIKQYPELGEVFAEYETRLLFLEGSLSYHKEESEPIEEVYFHHYNISLSKAQWIDHQQLKNELTNIRKELKEHIDISKKKKESIKKPYKGIKIEA